MISRKIVHIDQDECDGCGQCIPSCEEGAIRIVEGKARIASDAYCDGLGACLGHCPRDAITIVEREAVPFDEEAVAHHLARTRNSSPAAASGRSGCPGAAPMQLPVLAAQPSSPCTASSPTTAMGPGAEPSGLANWPIQLHLVAPQAPFLQSADILLVADCVPFACADFHRRFMNSRPVIIGCPKLDDGQAYVHKLAQIITISGVQSITVVHMEVPCCTGLLRIAEAAIQMAEASVPLQNLTVSTRGEIDSLSE